MEQNTKITEAEARAYFNRFDIIALDIISLGGDTVLIRKEGKLYDSMLTETPLTDEELDEWIEETDNFTGTRPDGTTEVVCIIRD